MRGLAEDTKKLSLSNSNTNNNNNTSSKTATNKKPTTSTAATTGKLGLNSRMANTNKPTKTQSQQIKQDAKATSHISGTGVANPATGAMQKQQRSQQQKAQQQQTTTKSSVKQTQQNNNASSTPKPTSVSKNASNPSTSGSTTIAIPKASHANTAEEIAGGVQDTIYLCNFRVSVDGEWLCLKELQDIEVSQQQQQTVKSGGTTARSSSYNSLRQRYSGGSSKRHSGFSGLQHSLEDNGILALQNLIGRRFTETSNNSLPLSHLLFTNNTISSDTGSGEWSNLLRDPAEIERSNLVNICKLVVKELLEQSLRYGRMLDSDHLPLQHFFIVFEHVLGHGLRPKKGLLGPRKELWDLLQSVETYCPEAQDITTSVRDLPTVRTHVGRARAWLRIALMQKKLADYLHALIENREEALLDYYEPYALMLSDEIVIILGILVGLNVIDCNLCVKEEDLDSQQGVIDFSLYLRSSSRNADHDEESNPQIIEISSEQPNMIAVLDQKNYIEELNRHLNATVTNLQAKIESLTTTNALMKEDLAIARNSLLSLQAENQAMRQHEHSQSDASLKSSGSGTSKSTIDNLTAELTDERKKNAELEKELKLQVSLKAESDMAMKLLEKDIHEKQDTIVSLRRQLDDIKQINLEMYRKLQECEDELTQKGEMVARLQTKASQIGNILQSLEKKYESKLEQQQTLTGGSHGTSAGQKPTSPATRRQQNLQKFEALTKKHKHDFGPPMKRLHLKMDALPPFNPNDYRKSPSAATAATSLTITPTTPTTTAIVDEKVAALKTPTLDEPSPDSCETEAMQQASHVLATPASAKSLMTELQDFEVLPVNKLEVSSKSDYAIVEKLDN